MKSKKVVWPETLKNHTKLINLIFHSQAIVIPQRLDLVLLQLVFFKGDLAKAIDKLELKPPSRLTTVEKEQVIGAMKQLLELVDLLFENFSRMEIKLVSLDFETYRFIRLNIVQQICLWLSLLPHQSGLGLRRKWLKNKIKYQKIIE